MKDDERSTLHKKNMDKYKEILGYTEPFPVICEADFIRYVETHFKEILPVVLEALLRGKVKLYSTRCINLDILGMLGLIGHNWYFTMEECEHDLEEPEYISNECLKSFVRRFPFRRLVVCCMKDSLYSSMARGRIFVTPDDNNGIKVSSVAEDSLEIRKMEDFRKLFSFRPPFPTVCEIDFVKYVEANLYTDVRKALELILCGEVDILETGADIRRFVRDFPSRSLVVCTIDHGSHYAQVPGRVVVTPSHHRGIEICMTAQESLVRHVLWYRQVEESYDELYKRLVLELLHSLRGFKMEAQPPVQFMYVATNGEEVLFTSLSEVINRMITDSALADSTSEAAEIIDVQFELSTDIQDDNLPVKMFIKKLKLPLHNYGPPSEITDALMEPSSSHPASVNEKGKRKKEVSRTPAKRNRADKG